nr:hypothetical protein [Corynebacterium lactis]
MGAQSWFEQAESRARKAAEHQEGGDDSASDVDVETTTLHSVGSESEPEKPASRSLPPKAAQPDLKTRLLGRTHNTTKGTSGRSAQRSSMATLVLTVTAIIAGVALVGTAAAALLMRSTDPAPVTMPAPRQAPVTESVGYAGTCPDASGKKPVAANRNDLRGTVVAFQTAYYNRDTHALMETVAANSGLAAAEWTSILDQAAPEGTLWCATLQPASGNVVDIDLAVTSPSGDKETYRQRVTGRQMPGSTRWQLTKIDSRQ